MSKSLISVMVLTYNHEKWIESCLNSLINQKDVNLEIIVHDDNSSDRTSKILEGYEDRCKVIRNLTGENIGISRSQNLLMDAARGDFLAIMSGDDTWAECKLKKQIDYLESHKECDFCFTDSDTLDEHGDTGGRFKAFISDNLNRKQWVHRLLLGNCLPAMSAMLRNTSWVKQNRFDVSLRQLQDWEYWIRAVCSGLVFHTIQEPLTHYRVLSGSVSHDRSAEKISRNNYETKQCLNSFLNLPLCDFREIFGKHIEGSELFEQDRSAETALAVVLSKVNNIYYRHAAADILHSRYKTQNSKISDHAYHDFIGKLGI